MDSLGRGGRLTRQGSRLRRQRSQEWQEYSSSDNEEDQQQPFRYEEATGHHYEDPRAIMDGGRKLSVDRGRGRGSSSASSGRSFSHSSMELLTGGRYGALSGSEGDLEQVDRYGVTTARDPPNLLASQPAKPLQYPAYGSLPRHGPTMVRGDTTQQSNGAREHARGSQGTRSRLSLSLRRGMSSSSTSDNNSDATYTDSEPVPRQRGPLDGQNAFPDSPPEPAPPAVPPRSMSSVHQDTPRGRRPRLGYLESECESEPPYLPTMLSDGLSPYPSQADIPPTTTSNSTKPQNDASVTANSTAVDKNDNNRNKLSRPENERIYSQPQPVQPPSVGTNSASTTVTVVSSAGSTLVAGATYSNPLPVFCGTPSSTTGPMVPVPNCVHPQLLQPPPTNSRAPFSSSSSSAFASAALASSRFHFRKSCSHRCSWKMATIVLIFLTIILTATMAYFAAMSSLNVYPESSKACIVVEDAPIVESEPGADATYATKVPGLATPPPSCFALQRDVAAFAELILGAPQSVALQPFESWHGWFSQPEAAFIRFNFSVPHDARLALMARKNDPPSITAYDFLEVVGEEPRKAYKRAVVQQEEVSLLHYLEPGTWFVAIVNDASHPAPLVFLPAVAKDVPTSCPSSCHGHGNCHLGKCQCFPGYIGPDCADSVCPVLCSGHGRYLQGSCRCEQGWKGNECNIRAVDCEVPDCNSHGRCLEGTCVCLPGFKGVHCETVDCLDPSCSGHGACVDGQCWCKVGWRGVNCSEADVRLSRFFPDCNGHGVYDLDTERCVCFPHWTGSDCSTAKCNLDCGSHGRCEGGQCLCDAGWEGARCDQRSCDPRCLEHGQCNNGTCICIQGWMGRHCTLDGCPMGCASHGDCVRDGDGWSCLCRDGWGGRDCSAPQETNCSDNKDNDKDGLVDCADSECCSHSTCRESLMCLSAPDPLDILLRKQPPAVTASFYQKMKFLIEEESVQSYAHRDEYSESRVAVIRGRVVSREGNGLIGIRISVATDPQFGFTLTRADGWFDILVNGGGAVTLQFQRNPFHPIKRTVMTPWNDLIVMETVVMPGAEEETETEESFNLQEPCLDHDYLVMRPIVYQTWRPGSQGGCTEKSGILAETQVLQESLSIPGSDLHLVYQSSNAQGYLSTIHLQLTPSTIPESLRLVHLRIVVEGILFEKTFEADPDIKFTYAWNKRNIYKQKVYGLTTARVSVGYEYRTCHRVIWVAKATTLRGYDMDISELGGWNLDIHHRFNFHQGVLQKGDGTTVYFRQQPRVISVLMGTGQQRPLLCPECNGLARDNKLLAPVALTSGPDGSVYVGDYNLIRRITPGGQVYTVLRLRASKSSYHYHLTLSPTDGHLYISDPERHQILRVHSLDKVDDPDSNFDVVVGSGERCLPRDRDNCGDGRPALEAKLSHPKGMAVSVDNALYFADGNSIRVVDSQGLIHTLLGDHHQKRQWRPFPCAGTLPMEQVKLRWPTDLAINPLDGSLYFLDDHLVLRLTKDKRVMVVAGQPVYCKADDSPKGRMSGDGALGSLISFAFGPTGLMYIAEAGPNGAHRVRTLAHDGELLHFAGRGNGCECDWQNCTCAADEKPLLARDTRLLSITSLTVTSDGVVHIADQGSLRILSAVPYLPQPDEQLEFRIAFPECHEMYIFNKYGQHTTTRSILTGRTLYTFLYNVNTSFGKLSAVTDASGNKVAFLRDSGNSLHTIETARGQKCRMQVTKQSLLETFVDPDNMQTKFSYDAYGLLVSRTDGAGRTFFYLYDENGRLTEVVRPSGRVTTLTFDLSPKGASVSSLDSDQVSRLAVTVRGTKVITGQGDAAIEITLHQDGAIEVETPWQEGVVWETAPHDVLLALLPVQAGMFPIPVRQTTFVGVEPTYSVEWDYEVKVNKREKDERIITAVERVLMVNSTQFLTVEYDWVAGREILYNSSRRPFLVVQYDNARPIQWLPTETRLPLNVQYDRLGRLSGWQQGPLAETYAYDRLGHLSEIRAPDNRVVRYNYEGKTMPSKITLPSGRKYSLHYDDQGGLKFITTPKGTRHIFVAHISIGFYKLYYTPPGNSGSYVTHFDDQRLPIMKIFPGDQGRILYRYNNQSQLTAIVYGGGKMERNYSSSGFVHSESWSVTSMEVRSEFMYDGAVLTHWRLTFLGPYLLSNAAFVYQYDNFFRKRSISARIGTVRLPALELAHNFKTGRLEQMGPFRIFDRNGNETVVSDGVASYSRQVDALHRLRQMSLTIADKEVYRMDLQYDSSSAVIQTKSYMRHLGASRIRVQNFSYDGDGQLVEMTGRDHWKFSYDENGNLVTMQYMGNRIDLLYDIGDRIVSFGETPYMVDGRGFVIQRGEDRFLYNTRGQLLRATRNSRYDVLYFYDARGRLSVRKDNFGNVTQFFYSDIDNPSLVTHIFNNADGRIATLIYDDTNAPVLIQLNHETFYVATDHSRSPLLVFDRRGEVIKEIHRGPYGHVLFDSNPTFYLPVDFQGGILDPLTGLVHFGERVYDSLVGQWITPSWEEVLYHLSDPRDLHLYRFNKNDPVNPVLNLGSKLDLSEWIRHQGIDLAALNLGSPRLFGALEKIDPAPLLIDMPSVPLTSGFSCAMRKRLESFSRLSSVERSKVKREQLFEDLVPKVTTQSVPFGSGITVSRIGGRALVRSVSEADPIRRDVFTSVFNNSFLLDLHLVMHGQDVFYFVKDSTWRVSDDLNQLQRLGSAINTTVHESKAEDARQGHHVDIRIHAHHAILNVRYGTSPDRERQRLLRHAKKHAVGQRWAQERELLLTNQQGWHQWTEKEKEHILNSGSVPGYRGDYFHEEYPELSDDPANIVFHKSGEKHQR